MPKLSQVLFGKKGKNKKVSTLTPEQEQLQKLITESISGGDNALSGLFGAFDQGEFDKGVTQPALKNFQENILPSLQEKFIAGNQVGGSGMQRAQNKAGVDLQSQLAQLMYQAQQQQKQNQMAGINTALGTKAFENQYKPGTGGALQSLVQGAGQGLGMAATGGLSSLFGGGAAAAGSSLATNGANMAGKSIAG